MKSIGTVCCCSNTLVVTVDKGFTGSFLKFFACSMNVTWTPKKESLQIIPYQKKNKEVNPKSVPVVVLFIVLTLAFLPQVQ